MDLRRAAFSGLRWVAAGRAIAEAAGLVSTIALARLVAPAEYGKAVIAVAFAVVVSALFQDGLVAPLVQREDDVERHRKATLLISVGLGLALVVLFLVLPFALAPVLGHDTASLIRLLAPIPLLEALAVVPRATLERALDFRVLGLVELSGSLISIVVSIALAVAGLGALAIVLGALAQSLLQALLLLTRRGLPPARIYPSEIRELLAFGMPAALASMVFQAWRNVDYVIVGARLGTLDAGLYYRAYTLAYEYQGKLSGIMLRLAFPLYSRATDRAQMERMRARIVRTHATALFPALIALIVMAPTLVPWVYGARWDPAVVPTQILAVGGLLVVIQTGVGPLLLATGHPKVLLRWNAGNFLAYAATVLVAAPSGLTTLSIAIVGFSGVSFVAMHVMLHRVLGLRPRTQLLDVLPATIAGAAMLGAGFGVDSLLASSPALVHLLGIGVAGLAVYLVVLRALFPAAWRDARTLADGLLRRAQPAAAAS